MKNGDRAADLEWRRQADEGGCADWGIAFACISSAPQRQSRPQRVRSTIAVIVLAAVFAALLITEGSAIWPL